MTQDPDQALAWGQGYGAAKAGRPVTANPYLPGPTTVTERLAAANVFSGLNPTQAKAALMGVLAREPDAVALQEWGGATRYAILKTIGTLTTFPAMRRWNPLTKNRKAVKGWLWVRPLTGRVVGLNAERYEVRFVKANILVGPGRVDKIKGYRTLLGASIATVVVVRDHHTGEDEVIVNYHLTTHVEKGGKYRPEAPLRAARHRKEVTALEGIIAYHQARGRRVYTIGDSNYNGLELKGLVSCWTDVPASVGGTHGPRRIDAVHGPTKADEVEVVASASDHRHPIATYTKRAKV